MKPRLSATQSFALYAIVLGFVFLFYLLGLLVGKNYFVAPKPAGEKLPVADGPVVDVKPHLGVFDDVMAPSTRAENGVPPEEQADSEPPAPFEIYTIQVAAVTGEDDARQILIRLEAKGYSAKLKPPEPGKGKYYRVWVGEFATPGEAQEMQARLKESGFPTFPRKINLRRSLE